MRGREIVTRHFDADGKIIGTSVREADWTESDWTEAVALAAIEADRCPDCGERRSRSKHPMMSGEYEVRFLGECNSCATWEEWRQAFAHEPNSRQYALYELASAPDQDDLPPIDWTTLEMPDPIKRPKASTDTRGETLGAPA